MRVSPVLRLRRTRCQLSLRHLAEAMGISFGYLRDLELGLRPLTARMRERHRAALRQLKQPNVR